MATMHKIRDAVYADSADLADVVIDANAHAFRGLVPDQCLEWLTKSDSMANWQSFLAKPIEARTKFLLVGESPDGRVGGCAMAGPQVDLPPYQSELFMLNILPDYQRQGLGRQLMAVAADRLAKAGMTSMVVRVLTINPNCAFYEKLGGNFIREEPYDWNGVVLQSTVYGWADTSAVPAFSHLG